MDILLIWLSFAPLMQRMKVLSDLLISVSKAERQEARLKVRQDSLRLGNVGVIRYDPKSHISLYSLEACFKNIV